MEESKRRGRTRRTRRRGRRRRGRDGGVVKITIIFGGRKGGGEDSPLESHCSWYSEKSTSGSYFLFLYFCSFLFHFLLFIYLPFPPQTSEDPLNVANWMITTPSSSPSSPSPLSSSSSSSPPSLPSSSLPSLPLSYQCLDVGGGFFGACLSLLSSYYGVYVIVFDCAVRNYNGVSIVLFFFF